LCIQDAFIGFGGNQVRQRVRNEAKWFVMDFAELIDALWPCSSVIRSRTIRSSAASGS